jgi:hypothetical protein
MSFFGSSTCAKILTEKVLKLSGQERRKLITTYSKYMKLGWAIMELRDPESRTRLRLMIKHDAKHTIYDTIKLRTEEADDIKQRIYFCIRKSLDTMILEER